ncbi:MAG: imidazolonepropionase [Planctomycetota bacterium]
MHRLHGAEAEDTLAGLGRETWLVASFKGGQRREYRHLPRADILIDRIGELVTLAEGGLPRTGASLQELSIVPNAAVAILGEEIVAAGPAHEVNREWMATTRIDAHGGTVSPGFVDPHTHPVFAVTREHEFEMRLQGKSYVEIALAGGGINSSVQAVRDMDEESLAQRARQRADGFLRCGTTTIEAKSGYGLSTEAELKMLRVIDRLAREHPLDVVPTFLGAHEIPPEYRERRGDYVDLVIEEMIPAVAESGLARYCDVFCEAHVFGLEETRRIGEAALARGLELRLHVDEIEPLGGAELAAELGAKTADHLGAISPKGIQALAEKSVHPVLLPGTSFFLRLPKHAPARELIAAGTAPCLATDFNPGSCPTQSMPMILTLACLQYRLGVAEAISAATVNAACSLGLGDRIGRIAEGLQADVVIWGVPNHRHLAYHFGQDHVRVVIKRGRVVYENQLDEDVLT